MNRQNKLRGSAGDLDLVVGTRYTYTPSTEYELRRRALDDPLCMNRFAGTPGGLVSRLPVRLSTYYYSICEDNKLLLINLIR